MSRRISAEVADRHIRQAEAEGKPPTIVGSFGDDGATLHMPKIADALASELALLSGRCVARYVMVMGHGCTGQGCRRKGHKTGLEAMREVLAMLREKPAPRAVSHARRFE